MQLSKIKRLLCMYDRIHQIPQIVECNKKLLWYYCVNLLPETFSYLLSMKLQMFVHCIYKSLTLFSDLSATSFLFSTSFLNSLSFWSFALFAWYMFLSMLLNSFYNIVYSMTMLTWHLWIYHTDCLITKNR